MIENYQEKINKLLKSGLLLYEIKISKNFQTIEVDKINIKYGTSLPDSKRNKGNIPLLASNGITDYVTEINSYNSITFGCRGTLGNVFYTQGNSFVLNTAFFINNPPNYGNLYFSIKYNDGLVLYSSGAAQPQITLDAIKNVKLITPIDDDLNYILDLFSNYKNILEKLSKIKKLLLDKYF